MNPSNPGKAVFGVIFLFLMVPAVALIVWAARRWLPPSNRLRAYLEKQDLVEVARTLTLLLFAAAAVVVTFVYS